MPLNKCTFANARPPSMYKLWCLSKPHNCFAYKNTFTINTRMKPAVITINWTFMKRNLLYWLQCSETKLLSKGNLQNVYVRAQKWSNWHAKLSSLTCILKIQGLMSSLDMYFNTLQILIPHTLMACLSLNKKQYNPLKTNRSTKIWRKHRHVNVGPLQHGNVVGHLHWQK